MESEVKKPNRISTASAVLLIFAAIVFDILELVVDWIPVVGQIISFFIDIIATGVFAVWFMSLGVGLTNIRALTRFWLTNFLEWLPIPVFDFGILTIGIILMIISTRMEDKLGFGLPKKPKVTRKKRVKMPKKQPVPVDTTIKK